MRQNQLLPHELSNFHADLQNPFMTLDDSAIHTVNALKQIIPSVTDGIKSTINDNVPSTRFVQELKPGLQAIGRHQQFVFPVDGSFWLRKH
jgi:hypothetical protein